MMKLVPACVAVSQLCPHRQTNFIAGGKYSPCSVGTGNYLMRGAVTKYVNTKEKGLQKIKEGIQLPR